MRHFPSVIVLVMVAIILGLGSSNGACNACFSGDGCEQKEWTSNEDRSGE